MKSNKTELSKIENSEFLLYTTPSGDIRVEVLFNDESIWATQEKIAQLFGVDRTVVTKHIKNIYESGELEENSTSAKIAQVQTEGERTVSRYITYYNLDIIISVGYRVNSAKATQFRIWATKRLKEYVIKGFTMDDERLKNGQYFGKDYFKELLERIRSIRSSERRIYLQITDIFQECSIDYDPNSQVTKDFFATVQNRFHYAISGQTAAEIIHSKSVNEFLNFNKYQILQDKGKISKESAETKAIEEYKEFNKTQRIENDFEKELIKKLKSKE